MRPPLVAPMVRIDPGALDDLIIVAEAGCDVVRVGTDAAEAMIETLRELSAILRRDGGALVLAPGVVAGVKVLV